MENKINITIDALEQEDRNVHNDDAVKKFDEKNYLNVKLGKDEKEKELRIRLLPFDSETFSPFKIIKMHSVKVNTQIAKSGYKNYVCIETSPDVDHEKFGNKCPFCELNRSAYKKSQEKGITEEEKKQWIKLSLDNRPKDVCIVRCIERGHEEDGPKFWKFNVRSDNQDPRGMIKELFKNRKQESIEEEFGSKINGKSPREIEEMCKESGFEPFNVLDIYEGKDLKITIKAVFDKENRRTNKTSITITDYGKVKPISENEEEVERWINDEKKWTDVFVTKSYKYLKIILEGKVPFFDKINNEWIARREIGRAHV